MIASRSLSCLYDFVGPIEDLFVVHLTMYGIDVKVTYFKHENQI